MKIVPLTAEAVLKLEGLEPVHAGFEITPDLAVELESGGGYAVHAGDKVLALAGILPRWQGCGLAWAWLSRGWRKHARVLTEIARVNLDAREFDRIEAGVRCEYARGHAWLRMLGFEMETPLARKWGPDGGDYSIYVRVR